MMKTLVTHLIQFTIVCLLIIAPITAVQAKTFVVNTLEDVNDGFCNTAHCSLREAVIAANRRLGTDIITLSAGTYRFRIGGEHESAAFSGDLDIRDHLVINGAGEQSTVIDARLLDRVFDVHIGDTVIQQLTLINGSAQTGGGGIRVRDDAALYLYNVSVMNNIEYGPGEFDGPESFNAAGYGGGIFSTGILVLTDSTVFNNRNISFLSPDNQIPGGGGIAVVGSPERTATLRLIRTSISENRTKGNGGGILSENSQVQIIDSVINGNGTPVRGGGIVAQGSRRDINVNDGTLELIDSRVTDNSADWLGGGVSSYKNPTRIVRTTIDSNYSAGGGGGIYLASLDSKIEDSTISNNATGPEGRGGGIYGNENGIIVQNTTVSGNSAKRGGGIYYQTIGHEFTNVTIADNRAFYDGAGIHAPRFSVRNTIIARNLVGVLSFNCARSLEGVTSLGHNLVDDISCFFSGVGDVIANPMMSDLGDNGGPTQTHALVFGSPAIDGGTNEGCPDHDQRGISRPINAFCDIGAYEWRESPTQPVPPGILR